MKHLTALLFLCGTAVCFGNLCPWNKPAWNCLINPCDIERCPLYPQATCQPNYCGGCNAVWYVGSELVDCGETPCPDGQQQVTCFANPCTVSSCPRHPGAECRPNYCGGCNADWYVNGHIVNCQENSPCPLDKPVVNCLVDPCMVSICPAYPRAQCRSNYCGGCNADWYVGSELVDCRKSSPCPDGQQQVTCFANPCSVSSCPKHPEAECRSNYCGGCFANWYVNDQRVSC